MTSIFCCISFCSKYWLTICFRLQRRVNKTDGQNLTRFSMSSEKVRSQIKWIKEQWARDVSRYVAEGGGHLVTWSGEAEGTLSPLWSPDITVTPSAKVWKYRNQCFQRFFPSTWTFNLEKELSILGDRSLFIGGGKGGREENFRGYHLIFGRI